MYRFCLILGDFATPSPPGEKASTRQDKARQSRTGDGTGDGLGTDKKISHSTAEGKFSCGIDLNKCREGGLTDSQRKPLRASSYFARLISAVASKSKSLAEMNKSPAGRTEQIDGITEGDGAESCTAIPNGTSTSCISRSSPQTHKHECRENDADGNYRTCFAARSARRDDCRCDVGRD